MVVDHHLFFIGSLQIAAHARRIRFGVELCAYHIIVKPQTHNGSFKRYMRAFFFYSQNGGAFFLNTLMIGFHHLIVATVNCIKWVLQSVEDGLAFTAW